MLSPALFAVTLGPSSTIRCRSIVSAPFSLSTSNSRCNICWPAADGALECRLGAFIAALAKSDDDRLASPICGDQLVRHPSWDLLKNFFEEDTEH